MINLDEALKIAHERIKRDINETDKIYLALSDLVGVAIRQHAKETLRLEAEIERQAAVLAQVREVLSDVKRELPGHIHYITANKRITAAIAAIDGLEVEKNDRHSRQKSDGAS